MYSKQEAGIIKEKFWTSLGQYLAPVPSAGGDKINWINYKTGIRYVNFKMDAFNDHAYIAIELSNKDISIQRSFFHHFKSLKNEIENSLTEKWIWEETVAVNDKIISRIYFELHGVNVLNQSDWPQIISFLKTRIIQLDHFWNLHKDIFEMLS